jgi:hypothetical protein
MKGRLPPLGRAGLTANGPPLLPLYCRRINRVMRPNTHAVPWPNDIPEPRFVRID